jgi:hypothetical protein
MFREVRFRRGAWVIVIGFYALGCAPGVATREPFDGSPGHAPAALTGEMEARVEAFCGDCHRLPQPGSFARDRWHFEVRRGYEFYAASGRRDLDPPPLQATLAYYRARAPERLLYPQAEESTAEPPVRFSQEKLFLDARAAALPEIAYLRWAALAPHSDAVLLASDMRHGHVVAIDLRREGRAPPRVLAQLRNPCRIEVCDLDGDGQSELVVADLGSYLPSDHDRGRVVLLRRLPGKDVYQAVELAGGLGRVADVRAADADGDGQLDLFVAEFGWRQTGRLLLLRNVSDPATHLTFEREVIDDRPGALDVRAHDFNRDGRPDLAVLFSQEYESIDMFVHAGQPHQPARFARFNLFTAPDLTFGSTGIELVDLNRDGEVDILYTNGDTFDNDYASPGHGVQWLENVGELKFVHRRLTDLPGAYRALPGDFDRDGHLDIVAVARLPAKLQPSAIKSGPLASVVLLRQTESGRYSRQTLEWDSPFYPTVAVGDFDGNGNLDFAVAPGPYTDESRRERQESHFLTVWWNLSTNDR